MAETSDKTPCTVTYAFQIVALLIVFQYSLGVIYTDQFVVCIEGGPDVAKELSRKYNFFYLNQVLEDCYYFKHKNVEKRSVEISHEHHNTLKNDPKVKWFSQQELKTRVKRDLNQNHVIANLNDPRWPHMWYLNRGNGLDMNVEKAWADNASGKGTVVTILDDGLEKDHPDIIHNYDPDASYDINNHDLDPQPRYDFLDSNRHGTRCAGEVAASANNSLCSVGVAFKAQVGGVRMLDGDVTDVVEALSLSLNPQHIDIYSASWGPDDDGKTVDGPGEMATRAFKEGIEKGRSGLGSIFVWASGNGGKVKDNCNCDGYTNAIWTLSISSATENGLVPWYSEACSSTLATTYSSGSLGERQIVTTDLHHGCTISHTGTSASAPLAAGICALALEANKKLTWRDMQHIVVRTARPTNLFAKDWKTNGVGRNVSHSFGYGMMDAAAMVKLARNWITVPLQKMCEVRAHHVDMQILQKNNISLSLEVHCDTVHYLEHVQAKVSLSATRRGDIHIYLISPSGTRSTLLAQRPYDSSRAGFQAWPFMTVHNWGENPNGIWTLEVHNNAQHFGHASLKDWILIFYGTTENPDEALRKNTDILSDSEISQGDIYQDSSANKPDISVVAILNNSLHSVGSVHVAGSKDDQFHKLKSPEDHRDSFGNDLKLSDNACTIMNNIGQCLDCKDKWFLMSGKCVISCPEGYFSSNRTNKICLQCHYTCKSCTGSNDYECATCYGDALLSDNYCRPKILVATLESYSKWYARMTAAFVMLCFVVLALLSYIISDRYSSFCVCFSKSAKYISVPTNKISHNQDSLSDT